MNVIMVVEGVLRQPVGGGPIPAGVALYRGLVEHTSVMLLSTDHEEDQRWLREEGLDGYNLLRQIHEFDQISNTIIRTVGRLRSTGPIALVIGADPTALEELASRGITVCVFLSAEYARPNWRPDFEDAPRAWDCLVEEVAHQRALKARRRNLESE